ncbi:hypothetical protein D3C80_1756090 [compost metagenome]
MFGQVRQLAVQTVVATGAEPMGRVQAVAVLRAQVELDGQFQVVHTVAVAQQHVQFAQGMPFLADGQVGGDQFHARRLFQGELP